MALKYDGSITVWFAVKSLGAALEWYQRVLGFEKIFEIKEASWAEVQSPTAKVTIGFAESETVEPRGGATPVFGVADIEASVAELKGHGVRFDGDIQVIPGMVKLATFYDPDGNKMMLSQSLMQG